MTRSHLLPVAVVALGVAGTLVARRYPRARSAQELLRARFIALLPALLGAAAATCLLVALSIAGWLVTAELLPWSFTVPGVIAVTHGTGPDYASAAYLQPGSGVVTAAVFVALVIGLRRLQVRGDVDAAS